MENRSFLDLLNAFANSRVAVLGDMMLDVYLWGQATRISPEAPVPVVNIRKQTACPGGAANVMRNISTLGGKVIAFGAIGNDAAGETLCAEMHKLGIDTQHLVATPGRCTTEKRRVIAGHQQLMRVDFEETSALDSSIRDAVGAPLLKLIAGHEIDAIIFEDYAKGLLSTELVREIADAAAKENIITALDPKPGRLMPVKNITVMKPNRGEAFAMAGIPETPVAETPQKDENLQLVAKSLAEKWAPKQLLISLAAQGMALFADGTVEVIPTRAREVYDVSGAGDTVISTYTLALCAGATPYQAAELANRAAGVVVGKVGTAPIYKQELIAELEALS